ncbi:Inner membrane transport protein YajR [Legionella massiliensis]|uniref:Inner membrane transport protein YajR n=1 Tax=Legionella massiliensis TaxID=1034943 RepID=A0A078KUC9_9GAMM|nr:MFS transporter [Legionella massiliensis]CDZ78055.1 Inner membrane transport protein YajR [Legionella massiliensis]CEE13793.1 Inner membrane transport protein YajR [Legionella massiliensis]
MKHSWLNSVFPIAAIFSFRMLGLFMLIPVFTVSAAQLTDATPVLIGLALGSYGLTQGILQMPFGMLSDRIGRKPVLSIGLLLFACGSLIGAFSHSIYTMILARTLQGTGAIGSVLIALLADLTPDEQRTKAMAVIGMTIGLSFSLAMVLSPALTNHYGLAGIFYLTTFLALLGLLLLHTVIPNPQKERFHSDSEANPSLFKSVISNKHLQRLNAGIFIQHFILTATFYVIPLLLQEQIKQGNLTQQWYFYLPLMFFSFVFMVPFIILAEKKRQMKIVFFMSVLITSLCQWFLALLGHSWLSLCGLMFFYFIAFNILEATLPSLISKQADTGSKGTAMGIYSSSQFLGIFIGGSTAGLLYQLSSSTGIFICNGLLGLVWLMLTIAMKPNAYISTILFSYPKILQNEAQIIAQLRALAGVNDVSVVNEEEVIYLRVDRAVYKSGSAEKILQNSDL